MAVDPALVGLLSLVGVIVGQVIARLTAPSVDIEVPHIHNMSPPTTGELHDRAG